MSAVAWLKISIKLPAVVVWLLVFAVLCGGYRALTGKDPFLLYRLCHAGLLWFFSISVRSNGAICDSSSTLYVANHVSYMDVFVLGSLVNGSFVAKSDVSNWPLLGKLATVQRTLFLSRDPRRARDQVELLGKRLATERLVLFPEGTSTPGTLVEPFRSTLFAAAGDQTRVQPIVIAYSSYKGRPMEQEQRDKYAWYLPMTFGPHFLGALGQGRSRVDIHFLEPVLVTEFSSRKACADHCETEIRRGLLEILKLDQEECPERYRPYSRRWKRHTGSAAGAAVN